MSPVCLEVSETTLVFAFRYALNRRTGATTHMVAELKRHWEHLTEETQREIHRDIELAGSKCEINTWREVLDWPIAGCPHCGMIYYNCLCHHGDDDEGCPGREPHS